MQITKFMVLVALFLSAIGIASEDDQPTLVPVAIKRVFIPTGFDSNDQVQVVVAGEFPDTCYKIGPHQIKRNGNEIIVSQFAFRYKAMCLDMIVPYNLVVDIGIVNAADHRIVDGKSGQAIGALKVITAKSPAVDDYLYAPVNEAMILEDRGGVGPVLYLTGNFPSKFMRIKEVRVLNYDDVVVVQPIAEMIAGYSTANDEPARPRFEFKKPLKTIPTGMFLLHVRSMNGKAINKIEELLEAHK